MKINRVCAVYFSAVKSTRFIVEKLAKEIAEKLSVGTESIDFTLPSSRTILTEFDSETLVVFGTPTYAGRVPNKVLPFVQNLFKGNNTPTVPIVTFGNRSYDSALTELCNELKANQFVPFAPHVAEELWQQLGHDTSVFKNTWPSADEEAMKDDEVEIPVQINGKTKAVIRISADEAKDAVIAKAKEVLGDRLSGNIVKEIYVPGKIVNIVQK